MATVVGTEPCPACRAMGHDKAGDNLVRYSDGSAHCFARGHDYQPNKGYRVKQEDMMGTLSVKEVARLPTVALEVRGISVDMARLFGVRAEVDSETGEVAAFYYPVGRGGSITGYQRKVAREPGKRAKTDVSRVGDTKGAEPFGAHIHQGGGKMVIVTEGAEDAMAACQMLQAKGKKYRVVSTLGTSGWQANTGFFEKFDKVVIAYDQDAAGKEAAAQFCAALRPGQGHIMRWGKASDPNALLQLEGESGADRFFESLMRAEPHKPDGILYGEAVWDRMATFTKPLSIDYPPEWVDLQAKTGGLREAEISLWTAGTSVGKTSYIRRLKQHVLTQTDWPIGEVELEERAEKTWRGLMQFHAGARWVDMSNEDRRRAYEETYGTNRIFTLDHRCQYTRGQSLVSKFKHLHYSLGAKILFLDHITLAVSEFGDGAGLQAQDQMMNGFLEFVETTGCHLALISHLRKSQSGAKSFEQGAVPSEDDLKGSGSLKQIAFDIIGVSRNKMHEDAYERNVSQLHVLKCRETGDTGHADRMYWDSQGQALVPARPEGTGSDEDSPEF